MHWPIYAKNKFAYTMGLFYSSSEGFLVINIQNVCGKAILKSLIPILVGVTYDGIICSMNDPYRV